MHGEQQGRDQAGSLVLEHAAHSQEKDAHGDVEDDVEEVVGGRAQLTEEVVQSEGEYRQRPVRLVAPLLCGVGWGGDINSYCTADKSKQL